MESDAAKLLKSCMFWSIQCIDDPQVLGDLSKEFVSIKNIVVSRSSSNRKSVMDSAIFQIFVSMQSDHPMFFNILQRTIRNKSHIQTIGLIIFLSSKNLMKFLFLILNIYNFCFKLHWVYASYVSYSSKQKHIIHVSKIN